MNWWRLKVHVHETWHFTLACGGVVLGLGLSQQPIASYFVSSAWLLIASGLFGLAYWRRTAWLLALAMLAGLIVGLWRGGVDQLDRQQYQPLYGKTVTLVGTVSEDVELGNRGETRLRLGDIKYQNHSLVGRLWVTINQPNTIRRSDVVELTGQLESGFGSFAGSIYQAEIVSVKRPQPGDIALRVREDFGDKVRLGIDEPAASLGMGYLTGQRRSLPPELDESLRVAGLTHIVVASGYNLTILVRLVKRLFARRSRYLTVFLSSLLIISFIAVTGLSPSMSRAGLIAGLALGSWYIGRKFHPVTLLVFAAAVTGLVDPSYVWGNLGWQLSFAAFAGVMILAPLLQAYFFGDKPPGNVRQVLGETVSAQIATAPLLMYSFGQISNVAVIANILVLPLVPLAMIMTWLTGLIGYLVPAIIWLVGWPTQLLLDYMVAVATTTSQLSWAQMDGDVSFVMVGVIYVTIGLLCWWLWRTTGYSLRSSNIIE